MKAPLIVAIILLFGLGGHNPDVLGNTVRAPIAEMVAPQEMTDYRGIEYECKHCSQRAGRM